MNNYIEFHCVICSHFYFINIFIHCLLLPSPKKIIHSNRKTKINWKNTGLKKNKSPTQKGSGMRSTAPNKTKFNPHSCRLNYSNAALVTC